MAMVKMMMMVMPVVIMRVLMTMTAVLGGGNG